MATFISKRLQASVLDTLRLTGEPMSVKNIAATLGISQQSVRAALENSGAVIADDSRPSLWVLPESLVGAKRVPCKHNDIEFVVSTKATKDIVALWNKQRATIGSSVAELEIDAKLNPGKTAEQLGSLAGSLAALAYELDQVKSMPDWYEILTDEVVS